MATWEYTRVAILVPTGRSTYEVRRTANCRASILNGPYHDIDDLREVPVGFSRLTHGCTNASELAERLISEIPEDEWRTLENGGLKGEISDFNRVTLLRLHSLGTESVPNWQIDCSDAERMVKMLVDFLDVYMAENPAASRWVVLSCLALAFIFREPLHPFEVVKVERHVVEGEVAYFCPACEGNDTLCGFCVCRPTAR